MARFGFLSTYPPTRCGLATFTESLVGALALRSNPTPRVVRAIDPADPPLPVHVGGRGTVVDELVGGDAASIVRSARALNAGDVAVIQHEYGIFGGRDGDEVLSVLAALTVPSIVVLHTVLLDPTPHQRQVLERVCALASAVVVMTASARAILTAGYAVDTRRVCVIPHGVPTHAATAVHQRNTVKQILTWGLIGPGKGLEWSIRAMAELTDSDPRARYTIVGQTHPKVLAHAGEAYRDSLTRLVHDLGLDDTVLVDSRYYDSVQLAATLASADVVVLPYDSRVQVTSGVLTEAIAAGIPVIATAFPHAVELLASGGGIVVPHENPAAIAAALRTVLGSAGVADRMSAAAALGTRSLTWAEVAQQYEQLAGRLLQARAA